MTPQLSFPLRRSDPHSTDGVLEPHYSVQDIADSWGLCENAVRDIFRNEPGVVRIQDRDFLHRHAVLQQLHGECVPEPMRVAALNVCSLEHDCQLAAPEIAGRFHSQ
jgi:hypothetical protein